MGPNDSILKGPKMTEPRTLADVVNDIRHSWANIPVPARFYLEDLEQLSTREETFYSAETPYPGEPDRVLVECFLMNAQDWQGATADYLKRELKETVS